MVLAAGFAVLIVATLGSPHSIFGGYPAAQLVSAAAIVTVAAVVSSRVPGNPVGWLFFLLGFGNLTTNVAGLYAIRGLELAPGSLPLVVPVAWLGTWSWIGQLIALPLLMPLFPNGEPLTRRWRPIVWLQVAAGSMAMITWAVISFPIAGWRLDSHGEITNNPPAAAGILVSLLLVTVIALLAAAAVSSVLRLGRSTGEQRQQLKGFVAGGALVSGNSAVLIGMLVSGQADQVLQPVASALNLSIGVLALASGLAILRYRLYDIDIVISRTLVYGGLAVAITAVYLGLIVGVGSLVGSRSGLVLTVVATAIVGLAFQPARARLQRYANRLVYGRRGAPRRPTKSCRTSASAWQTRSRPTTSLRGWRRSWQTPRRPSTPTSGYGSATCCALRPPGPLPHRASLRCPSRVTSLPPSPTRTEPSLFCIRASYWGCSAWSSVRTRR